MLSWLGTAGASASPAENQPSGSPGAEVPAESPLQVDEGHGGILYGPGYAFILSAPTGWVFDDQTGKAQGVTVVFYRQGESWTTGQAVMYANVAYKRKGQDNTIKKVIKYDIRRMKERRARMLSATRSSTRLADGRKAIVYGFAFEGADEDARREKVAYVDTPKVVVMLVLTARSEAVYRKAAPDFESLVRSFQFVGRKVQIKQTGREPAKGRKKRS
jgi:hypothetical protein